MTDITGPAGRQPTRRRAGAPELPECGSAGQVVIATACDRPEYGSAGTAADLLTGGVGIAVRTALRAGGLCSLSRGGLSGPPDRT
ncbi:hypothetical protein GCM10010345_58100 [Streptomyces canarius]|uniref:Uncharacterized protein n=1 Tax=Streptomyces canarius TaxID=285453 RepID=A0ABQ3CWF0_9ACTN|nr:hypothetical protein GCM10010345_58100 [Streptomyces canarius]